MPPVVDLVGKRFGRLVVVERIANIGPEAGWLALCICGNTTKVRGSKLRGGRTRSCGCLRVDTTRAARQKDIVDYAAVHDRLRVLRGRAKDHACADCGEKAHSWSYDRRDPDELIATNKHGRGLAYSLDPAHYQPRCKPCHARFDAPSTKAAEHAN